MPEQVFLDNICPSKYFLLMTDTPESKLTSEAAKELSKLGAAKGGLARAKALTPDQRRAIAVGAIEARWKKAGKPETVAQATHGSPDSPLRIGEVEIPCFVLEDGRRVLAQRGMITALGMKPGGSS